MRASRRPASTGGPDRSTVLVDGKVATGAAGVAVGATIGRATGGASVAIGAAVGATVGATDGVAVGAATTTELTVAWQVVNAPPPLVDPLH